MYRLSTLPWRFLGLEDPVLAPGADASMVLFDWQTVSERNDYLNPLVPPQGIDAVWVHGDLVLDHGTFHPPARFPGRILKSSRRIGL